MKHLKKFNESVDDIDVDDIVDLFQETADKYFIQKKVLKPGDDIINIYHGHCYIIGIYGSQVIIDIKFIQDKPGEGLQYKFETDLNIFMDKIRAFGYTVQYKKFPKGAHRYFSCFGSFIFTGISKEWPYEIRISN